MVRNRIYNKDNKVVGTLYMDDSKKMIGLQFGDKQIFKLAFRETVNKFLKDNGLKPVSDNASFRKHYNHKEYCQGMEGIDIYYRWHNPRTRRVDIKLIKKRSEVDNGIR